MVNEIEHYKSYTGLEVYQFEGDNTITITGNVIKKYTIRKFDSAYDFETYIQEKIDCDGIELDSEYSQFFAYAKTQERAIKFVKDIETWFEHVREILE